jgi:hypothetical protein
MRKLESMIAQFVDDLLLTIGEASIEELRELFASRPESPADRPRALATRAEAAISAGGPNAAETAPRGRRASSRAPRRWSDMPLAAAPPGVAEITDPESLLSLVSSAGAQGEVAVASAPRPIVAPIAARPANSAGGVVVSLPTRVALTEVHAEPEGESPASGVRPVGNGGPPVRLSDNETLARVSNSGVVIRRKKKG